MLESVSEKKLKREIEGVGGLCYKFTSPGRQGVPDRVCIIPGGHVVFVEMKQENGSLRPLQRAEIARMKERGADVWVVYGNTGVDAFMTYVKEVLLKNVEDV